jgi:LmbE family N-acetylglucosaminyl deacetylase
MTRFIILLSVLCSAPFLLAQQPAKPSAADLHQAIKKLNVLGSLLYVAAHPDDENQRMISYYANEKLFDVTYLSLTRGDGGQNLIGPELRELLGVLRSEELLMARKVDGGFQRFTRANDFGFSKNPEETLRIWNKDEVLSDVVWAMRQAQPDVVINRFFHDKKYDTHGHHTASAMLSVEAFDLAGRNDAYTDQLKWTAPWQPNRIFYNTSWWFYGGREKFNAMDKSHLYTVNAGVYLPLKGKSNNELADEARSMHRCQGFGSMTTRGEQLEYLEFIKGEKPPLGTDLFEGINTSWTRVAGGEKIGKLLKKIDDSYRSDNPAASVSDLIKAHQLISALPDGYWKKKKLADLEQVIKGCLGLYLEVTASGPTYTPGDNLNLAFEAIVRNAGATPVQLQRVVVQPMPGDTILNLALINNVDYTFKRRIQIPANAPFSAPYWLLQPFNDGMYEVAEQVLRGLPETPRPIQAQWSFNIGGTSIIYTTPLAYKVEEPAKGEVWRPFEILPPAYLNFAESAYLFSEQQQVLTVKVTAGRERVNGRVRLVTPAGWKVTGDGANGIAVSLNRKGEEKLLSFTVEAPAALGEATIGATIEVDGRDYDMRLVPIAYDHIPTQSVLLPARTKAARLDLKMTAKNVGYYMGAGDDVPAALRRMGCQVTLLEDEDLNPENLRRFDAIVVGVRAYNTRTGLAVHHTDLFEYVKQGGILVTQYNNNYDYTQEQISPIPLKLSRARVTDESAEVRFLLPEHAVLNYPNVLSSRDFEGWVQERGLYFASEWDPTFAAPLSLNDPGEKANNGALLVAPYGSGKFIYTGFSFFRELPMGVPGAYRLLANLISKEKAQ